MKIIVATLLFVALAAGDARVASAAKANPSRANKSGERANRPLGSAETERGIRRAEGLSAKNYRASRLDVARAKSAPLNRRAEALVELGQNKLTLREAISREIAKYKLVKDIQAKQPLENPLGSKAKVGDQAEVAAAIKVLDEGHAIRNPLTRLDLAIRKRSAAKGIADKIGRAATLEEAEESHGTLKAAVGAEDPGVRRTADALEKRAWKQAKIGGRRGDVELTREAVEVARRAAGEGGRGIDHHRALHVTAETAQRAAERLIADGEYRAADAALEHVIPAGRKVNAGTLHAWARLGAKRQARLLELRDIAMGAHIDGAWREAEHAADDGDADAVRARVREVKLVERRRDGSVGAGTARRERELLQRAADSAPTISDTPPVAGVAEAE